MTRRAHIIELARDEWREYSVDITDQAEVSEGDDNGAYVQAWVWVSFADTELDKHPTGSDTGTAQPGSGTEGSSNVRGAEIDPGLLDRKLRGEFLTDKFEIG